MLLMLRRFMATLIALLLLSTAASGQMPNASYPPISAGGQASFSPAITPAVSGAPGANRYLQTNSGGLVSWATKPTAAQISYTPANAGQWPIVVANIAAALDSLANSIAVLSGLAYSPAVPSDWITSPAQIPTGLDQLAQRTGRPLEFAPKVQSEEFVTFGSSGTVTFGDSTNWQTSSSGTGSSIRAALATELTPAMFGALAIVTGTTTGGRAGILGGPSSALGGLRAADGTGLARFDVEWTVMVPVGFDAVNTGWAIAGLTSSVLVGSAGNNGLFWRYDGGATQQLSAVIRSNSVETGSAYNVATLTPGTSYRLRITSDGINVVWRLATGRSSTSYTTYLTVPAATLTADAFWQTNPIGPAFRVQKTAGTTSVVILADHYLRVTN